MNIINCTPHVLNVHTADDEIVPITPSGDVPRCATTMVDLGTIAVDGVPVALTRQDLGAVSGMPDPTEGTLYVVSRLVADALPGLSDLLIPGPLVRDDQGRVTGCRGLSVV